MLILEKRNFCEKIFEDVKLSTEGSMSGYPTTSREFFGHEIVHDSRSTIIEELVLGWAFVSLTCRRTESPSSAVRSEGVNLIAV